MEIEIEIKYIIYICSREVKYLRFCDKCIILLKNKLSSAVCTFPIKSINKAAGEIHGCVQNDIVDTAMSVDGTWQR